MTLHFYKERVVSSRTSAIAAGNTGVVIVKAIDSIPIEQFDEILVYIEVPAQFLDGTAPTLDIYLQRGAELTPSETLSNTTDWQDFAASKQFTAIGDDILVIPTPLAQPPSTTDEATGQSQARNVYSLAAAATRQGHWGDMIRIGEKVGGSGATVGAIYSVVFRGLLRHH